MARQRLFSRRNQAPARASNIDDLTKLRKGGFSAFAQDTGEQAPNILPGGRIAQAPQTQLRSRQNTPIPEAPVYEPIPQEPLPEIPQEPQNQGQVMGASTGGDVGSFLEQFAQQTYQPQQNAGQDYLEKLYKVTGTTYGVASLRDGRIQMNDGTVKDPNQEIFPVASDRSGGVIMSDGSKRSIDPRIGAMLGQSGTAGVSNLLFGQQQQITQPFGNINPIEPTPGNVNLGTDFRTRDLSQKSYPFPVGAEVVEVLQDDGTRFGDKSGHQGYGNSVLLRLPTGEMFRLSHLAQLPNVQVGQRVNAGELQVSPGQTGNTYGEHLDVEYFNAQGQLDDPKNFKVSPELIANATEQPQQPQASMMSQPQQPQGQVMGASTEAPQQNFSPAPPPSAPTQLANTIDRANPTGNMGVGATELLRGNVPAAGREISNTIEQLQPTGSKVDFGVSEAARGDLGGAKSIWEQNLSRIRQKIGQGIETAGNIAGIPETGISEKIAGAPTPSNVGKASAYEGSYSTNDSQPPQTQSPSLIQQAGQGLASLARFFNPSAPQAQSRPALASMNESKAVGSSPNASLLPGVPNASQVQSPNDIRDPFFKSGQIDQFGQFVNPGQENGSALSLDIFKPEFFRDEQNISKVFGGTNLAGAAQGKYDDFQKQEAERKAAEERQGSASLADYLAMGKTAAQWFAETGRQGELDSMGGPDSQKTKEYVNTQNYTPSDANFQSTNGVAQYVPGPSGKPATRPVSSGAQQNYTPSNANFSSVSGASSYIAPPSQSSQNYTPAQSQSKPGIFSGLVSSIQKLFRR